MQCPACACDTTRVIDSRPAAKGREIRRRRSCENPACENRFTTYERIEAMRPTVRKKRDGRIEPFDPKKLLNSLQVAAGAIDEERYEKLKNFVKKLDSDLSSGGQQSIETTDLGKTALDFLRGLDPVAYVRYASVYDKFSTVEEFIDVLRPFQTKDGADTA